MLYQGGIMFERWYTTEEALKAFEKSEAYQIQEKQIARIGELFQSLNERERELCIEYYKGIAARDEERSRRLDANLVGETEIYEEEQAEIPEIISQIQRWFTFINDLSEQDQSDYAHRFLDFMHRRNMVV